jgi:hypothetical protein
MYSCFKSSTLYCSNLYWAVKLPKNCQKTKTINHYAISKNQAQQMKL